MTTTYKTVLTAAGRAAFAAAGRGVSLQLKYISVGDAGGTAYTPDGTETSLKHRVWRGTVHRAVSVPGHTDQLLVEGVVPVDEGGWTVREVGLLDARSRLLAVASYPETHKSTPQQGAGTEIVIQLILKVANAASVTLTLDSSAAFATTSALTDAIAAHAASRNHPAASTSATGLARFADDAKTDEGTAEDLATTPKGVKTSRDKALAAAIAAHAASRDHPAASTAELGLVKFATTAIAIKGKDTELATNSEGVMAVVDQELDELKTSLSTLSGSSMTAVGIATAIQDGIEKHEATTNHPDASVNAKGMIRLATSAQTKAGEVGALATTPEGVKAADDAVSAAAATARSTTLSNAKSHASGLLSAHAGKAGHPGATATRIGPVRLATTDEDKGGRHASIASTPKGVKAAINILSAAAANARSTLLSTAKTFARSILSTHANGIGHAAGTTTKKGPVQFATTLQTRSGSSTGLASAPAGVKSTINARLAGLYGVPTGAIMSYSSATAPSGWLICDGAVFSRTTYSGLYAVIGTRFGGTSTSPNLPDLRNRFVMGDDTDTSVGEKGGTSSHTHTATVSVGATTLTADQMPRHLHGHGIHQAGPTRSGRRLTGYGVGHHSVGFQTDYAGASQSHTHTSTSTPASTATLPPYVVLAYIIRT